MRKQQQQQQVSTVSPFLLVDIYIPVFLYLYIIIYTSVCVSVCLRLHFCSASLHLHVFMCAHVDDLHHGGHAKGSRM